MAILKIDDILFSTIGFDEKDLEANRNGRLSPQQAQKLLAKEREIAKRIIGFMIMLSLVLLPSAYFTQENGSISEAILLVWLFMMTIFLGVLAINFSYQEYVKLGRVATVRGKIECFTSGRDNNRYHLRIKDVTFNNVGHDIYMAFTHLDRYIIYYMRESNWHNKQIVAAEPFIAISFEDQSVKLIR